MDNFLRNNLKFLRERHNLTLAGMGDAIDIKKNTISNYENGITEPKIENLGILSKFFGYSIDDLVHVDLSINHGKGQIPTSSQMYKQKKQSIVAVDTSENSVVPILDVKAAAGSPTILDEPDYYKELPAISFPHYFFRTGVLVGIQVRGDSMSPTIKQGDYVIGKEIEELMELKNGEVYIIVNQEDQRVNFTVKRCYYHYGDESILLISDNTDYPEDSVRIDPLLKVYHVELCLTTQLFKQEPSVRGHLERIERRIDRLEKKVN